MSLTSGPGPPVVMEKDKSCLHYSDNDNVVHADTGSHAPADDRRMKGKEEDTDFQPEGNGSNALKSQAGTFETTKTEEVEGDASLEVTPEAENAGKQAVVCPIQVERRARDGRGEVVLRTPWLVETVGGGASLKLVILKADGSYELKDFPTL